MALPRFTLFSGLVAIALAGGLACSSSTAIAPSGAAIAGGDEGGASTTSGDGGGVTAPIEGGPAVDAGPASIPSSGGHGGLACTRSDDLGGGRMSCVAKIGRVELKVVVPKASSANAPLRLGLYLHGDGAAAHKSNGVLKAMLPWADAQNGLAISALAPNGCAWWLTPMHDCAGTATDADVAGDNAAALVIALDAVMKAFDVRTDGVRYYGSSGGSIFLTDEWLPLQAGTYPGVFALMCGGETSTRTYAWDTSDATMRAKNPLWFTYGDQDFLAPDITNAIASFKAKSFAVTEKVIAGATHCAFDAHGAAMSIWSANP
jgi:hypothetical protein